jgi:hypothetical protein
MKVLSMLPAELSTITFAADEAVVRFFLADSVGAEASDEMVLTSAGTGIQDPAAPPLASLFFERLNPRASL